MHYLLLPIFCIIWVYLGRYFFKKKNILDNPWPDIPPRPRVPTMQGIVLFLVFILWLLIFFPQYLMEKSIIALLIWGWLIVLISVIDNIKGIPPKYRLIFQTISILIAFFIWWIGIKSFMFLWNKIEFNIFFSLLFTFLWFVLFINAINWFDWINSMASWVSSIGFLTIFLLLKIIVIPHYPNISSDLLNQLNIVINISFFLFLLSLIYTFLEFKPLGLLRDSWVMFLGFSLAYLALLWWAKIGTILVVLSLVIFDSIWVAINRIFKKKKSPLKWDYTHFHHRLMAINWTRTEIRVFVRAWSLFFMILMILQWTNRLNKIIIFVMMFVIFFGINYYIFWRKKLPSEYVVNWKTEK